MDNPGRGDIFGRMDKVQDAIVIGGGLNGSTLALALARSGLRTCLIERLPPDTQTAAGFDGRSYALAHASARLLRAIGLWDGVAAEVQPIEQIRVWDGRAGEGASPLSLLFDGAEIEDSPPGYMLEDRHLRRALAAALPKSGAGWITGAEVVDHEVTDRAASVRLADGREVTGQVMIAADGMASATARRAGIRRLEWGYRQTSFSCAIAHDDPHHGIAHQLFLPAGPLAILPLRNDRASIVWTEDSRRATEIAAMDDAAYLALLRPRIGSFLGDFRLDGQRHAYAVPLSLAQDLTRPRLALIGDAAHRVHPLAGQGLNAGLKDVAALAEVLALAKRRGEDIGRADVLARYARWRRFDVASLALATDAINRLFSNDNPLLRLGRDLGLGLVNSLPGLRRTVMREAAGVTGDLPRLLQGRPI